ncbi:MAG: helix-turn-helix domain-containing protein [Anaerolineales bacterium]|jgi:excisionase family DNA binding protein
MTDESWLSITEASKFLGVHPSTLRRWANAEQIPFTRTHGGHRRFSLAALRGLQAQQGRLKHLGGLERRWSEVARRGTRRELEALSGWGEELSENARARFRQLGRELLELTTDEIGTGERASSLQDAARIGAEYVRLGRRFGLTLEQLTQAVLLAQSSLIEAALELPEVEHLQRSAVQSVLAAIQRIMQAVQMAMVKTFMSSESGRPKRKPDRRPDGGERKGS